jgi:hypothetical protein
MKNSLPKILLACPISSHKDYIINEWAKHVRALVKNYPGTCDVLLCDNSNSPTHAKKVERETGLRCDYVHTQLKNNYDAISFSRNYLRGFFLEHNYDYWLSLECDLFPPICTIFYLLSFKKKMVGFPYFIGEGEASPLMVQQFEEFGETREAQNMPMEQSCLFIDGTLKQVFSIGLGCMMMSREVVEKIPFRTNPDVRIHDDSFFAEDCQNMGIKIYCDTSVIPIHINQAWNRLKHINL